MKRLALAQHEPEVLRSRTRSRQRAAMHRALIGAAAIAALTYAVLQASWMLPAIARLASF